MTYAIMNTLDTPKAQAFVRAIDQHLQQTGHCPGEDFDHSQVIIILSLTSERIRWLRHIVDKASSGKCRILYCTDLTEAEKTIIKGQKKNHHTRPKAFQSLQGLLDTLSKP